jgi:hypothetical protein
MIRTVIVNYKGEELTCKGYYTSYRNNGLNQPPDIESFEINYVVYRDVDITHLLSSINFDWLDLEECCLDKLR